MWKIISASSFCVVMKKQKVCILPRFRLIIDWRRGSFWVLASFKSHIFTRLRERLCVLRGRRRVSIPFLFNCCFKASRDTLTHNTLLLAFLSSSFLFLLLLYGMFVYKCWLLIRRIKLNKNIMRINMQCVKEPDPTKPYSCAACQL